MMIRTFSIAALAILLPAFAAAGEQYVDASGYANSGYDVVAYFELEQAPVGAEQPPAVPGRAEFTARYNGAEFAFATAANRARFEADPARYAPQFDGHCAYGVAQGSKVPGNPDLWRIVDGKLYVNFNRRYARSWERDIPGNLERAAANWRELEDDPASQAAVPRFDVSEAPLR